MKVNNYSTVIQKLLAIGCLSVLWVILGCTPLAGQGFTIKNFDVKISVAKEGYFDVEENIEVFFTERKHGIFRSIPFKYDRVSVKGPTAKNRIASGNVYVTPLENIGVADHDFVVTEKDHFMVVRIGSASEYVEGKQIYTIRYRVHEAINEFDDHDEFFWNVTGNE